MIITYSESNKPRLIKHKLYWVLGNLFGISFIRIRSVKNRYGIKKNKTFRALHFGKYSFFKSLKNPTINPLTGLPHKKLWFKKLVSIGETNKSMKIFEVCN